MWHLPMASYIKLQKLNEISEVIFNILHGERNKTTAAIFISCRALHGKKYLFRDIHTFSFSAKIQDGRQRGENPNFTPLHRTLLYYPVGQKFTRNRSIFYGFQDIHTFSFTSKIQDGQQKWRKSKFYPFAQNTLVLPCGLKISSKSLSLLRFSRYSHFFIYHKNPRWPPIVAKIEIFPLSTGHSCTTKKFTRNRYMYYGFQDIHTFSFSAKI